VSIFHRLFSQRASRAAYQFLLEDWTRIRDLDALSSVLSTQRFSGQRTPLVRGGPTAERTLVFSPHPDDDTFGCGGALLHARRNGATVHVVYVTSGERDGLGGDIREGEARRVATALGATVEFWHYPTRSIPIGTESVERMRHTIAVQRPGAIFLPFLADDHPDHRRVAELFASAFHDAPAPDAEVWAYQVYSTVLLNVVMDVTDVMEEKLQLVRMWESEMAHRDWVHYIHGLNAFNSRSLRTKEPRYAEHYFVVPAHEYIALCGQYFPGVAAR